MQSKLTKYGEEKEARQKNFEEEFVQIVTHSALGGDFFIEVSIRQSAVHKYPIRAAGPPKIEEKRR